MMLRQRSIELGTGYALSVRRIWQRTDELATPARRRRRRQEATPTASAPTTCSGFSQISAGHTRLSPAQKVVAVLVLFEASHVILACM